MGRILCLFLCAAAPIVIGTSCLSPNRAICLDDAIIVYDAATNSNTATEIGYSLHRRAIAACRRPPAESTIIGSCSTELELLYVVSCQIRRRSTVFTLSHAVVASKGPDGGNAYFVKRKEDLRSIIDKLRRHIDGKEPLGVVVPLPCKSRRKAKRLAEELIVCDVENAAREHEWGGEGQGGSEFGTW